MTVSVRYIGFIYALHADATDARCNRNGCLGKRCEMDFSTGAAWMNGQVMPVSEAKISVFDWGLTRSDVTYDVVHVWEGAFFRLDDYLDRFEVSMEKLRLNVGMDRHSIRAALIELVATSGLQSAYVSMVASRGTPIAPGTRDPRTCSNHFYAWAVPH